MCPSYVVNVNITITQVVDSVNILAQDSFPQYHEAVTSREHYHHGDLRSTLIAEGLKQLEERGDDLSLRALSKAAGVSPNAPYRHFPDKKALMGALAAEGFKQFADAVVEAADGPPREALIRQGQAYLEFALAHPALYRLMFSPYGYSLTSENCQREAGRAFGSLIATAGRAQAAGWKTGLPLPDAVLAYWSALHGWAGLVSDGLIPPGVPQPTTEAWLTAFFETKVWAIQKSGANLSDKP
jgi:AcrR family transcriptional regulator